MTHVVIENATLAGARVAVAPDSLPDWELRGWALVGPCADRSREPLLTDDEQAKADVEREARIAAATKSPEPTAGTGRTAKKSAPPAAETKES